MKKPISLLTCFLFTFIFCSAQDVVKEVGLTFSSLDNFGLAYKKGTSAALWRFNWAYISGHTGTKEGIGEASTIKEKSYGFSFGAGREFRKPVGDEFQIRYGLDIDLGYSYGNLEEISADSRTQMQHRLYTTSLKAVIGLNYVIREKIVLGAEILPGIYYRTGKETTRPWNYDYDMQRKVSAVGASLSSSSAMLTLAYRL